jgi:predicted GNAT family acetyltransferase
MTIQAHLRASIAARAERVGPFLALITPDTPIPGRNYAIPDDGARPTPAEVAALVAYFRHRDRQPRLEYLRPAPAVDAALTAAGFTTTEAYAVLEQADLTQPSAPDGIEIRHAVTDDDFAGAADVQQEAYGGPPVSGHDRSRLRNLVAYGGSVVIARTAGGEYVGTGLHTTPTDGRTEVAAVGVRVSHRRRGIASAIGYELSVASLRSGAAPFLQAEGPAEQRMYERLGYHPVGELVAPILT